MDHEKTAAGTRRSSRQRGWLRNPFPCSTRVLSRLVAGALRAFSQPQQRKALFETFEPRILLSGDPFAAMSEAEAQPTIETSGDAVLRSLHEPDNAPVITWSLAKTSDGSTAVDALDKNRALASFPSDADFDALLAEAAARMGFDEPIRVEVADLSGPHLARSTHNSIQLDVDAMGYGWFVDQTPHDDSEYEFDVLRQEWVALADGPAAGAIDLLTTLMHEIGHLRGDGHSVGDTASSDVMQASLGAGLRRIDLRAHAHEESAPGQSFSSTSVPESSPPASDISGAALIITPSVSWIGTSGSWEVGANWSTGIAPGINDDVLIDVAGSHTITIQSAANVRTLLSSENITLQSGSLTIGTEAELTGTLTLAGGTVGGAGALTVTGAFNVSGSATLSGAGEFTTQGVSTLSMAGGIQSLSLTGGKHWINEGTVSLSGDDRILFGSTGTNTLTNAAGATFNLSSTFSTPLQFNGGVAVFNNAGILNQTLAGAHAITNGVTFNNTGEVNVDAGTLMLGGSGTDTGQYAVDEGAVLSLDGGTRTLNANSNVTGLGRLTVSGATVNVNNLLEAPVTVSGGTLNVNTAEAVTLPSLTLSGGTLSGSQALTVTGAFNVSGSATLSGAGEFTTQGVSTLSMAGGYKVCRSRAASIGSTRGR